MRHAVLLVVPLLALVLAAAAPVADRREASIAALFVETVSREIGLQTGDCVGLAGRIKGPVTCGVATRDAVRRK